MHGIYGCVFTGWFVASEDRLSRGSPLIVWIADSMDINNCMRRRVALLVFAAFMYVVHSVTPRNMLSLAAYKQLQTLGFCPGFFFCRKAHIFYRCSACISFKSLLMQLHFSGIGFFFQARRTLLFQR